MQSTTHPKLSVAARLLLTLAAAALVLVPGSSASAAPGWNHEVLDSGTSTGEGISTIYWPVFSQHHVFNVGIDASAPVLRHGWYQPGYSGWAFETLDAGNSTGRASATGLWASQHHVFNEGDESATPVLRHGWYQEGAPGWQFETLDAGISTGTDTAYADYMGQQHVFTHGIGPTGEDILRHGYYDPGVGVWAFETLDQGFSGGMGLSSMVWANQLHYFSWLSGTIAGLRHGWHEPGHGWKFETLVESGPLPDASPTAHSASLATVNGKQNVWSSAWEFSGFVASPFYLKHGVFAVGAASWQFTSTPVGGGARADGRAATATEFQGKTQVFDYATSLAGACVGIYHAVEGGYGNWEVSAYSTPCASLSSSPKDRPVATATFPPYNQLHAFYAQDPLALGHFWYNPA